MNGGCGAARFALVVVLWCSGCMVYPRAGIVVAPARPPVVVVAEPRLVAMEGFDIRYCPDCDEDVFFYLGVWYVYRSGGWYWCSRYGDRWVLVEHDRLPAVFIKVPPGHFKHRFDEHHPAHAYFPREDTWGQDNQGGGGKGKGKGRGKGRGRGRD